MPVHFRVKVAIREEFYARANDAGFFNQEGKFFERVFLEWKSKAGLNQVHQEGGDHPSSIQGPPTTKPSLEQKPRRKKGGSGGNGMGK